MANITVSVPLSNITVNTTSNVVNVSTTTSNVVVSELSQANTAAVRQALSVTDTGGDGSLTYSNTTGVFTYTGPNQDEANARIDAAPANVRAHLSGTSPITYNSGTGAIGIDANAVLTGSTTDDLAEGSTNLYWSTSGQAKTTTNLPEGTNLYYTVARANTAIEDFDGVLTPSSLTATGNVEGAVLKGTGTLGLVVTGNATIGGNLDVTGNINSETVVDLLVEDRNITLQYGLVGAPTNNAHIFVDRGSSANVALFWDETNDTWKFNSSNIANTDADIQLVPFYGSNSAIHYEGNIIIEPDVNTSFYTQNVDSIQAFAVRSNVNNQYGPVANIGLRYDRKDGLYNVSAPVMRVWDQTAGAGINLADNGNAFVSIYSKKANVLTGNTLSGAFHVGSSQTVSAGEIGVEIEFYPQLFKIQGTTPTDPNYHLVETLIGDRKYIPHIDIKSIAPGSSDTWGANTAYRPSAKTYNLDPFIIVDEHIELQAKTDAYADSNVAANVDVLKLTTSNASRTFEFVVDGTSNLSSVNATTLNVPTITGVTSLSATGNISANNFIGDVTGTVSDISNHTTDDLAEGNTNLYFNPDYANSNVEAHYASGNVTSNIITSANIAAGNISATGHINSDTLTITGNIIGETNVLGALQPELISVKQYAETGDAYAGNIYVLKPYLTGPGGTVLATGFQTGEQGDQANVVGFSNADKDLNVGDNGISKALLLDANVGLVSNGTVAVGQFFNNASGSGPNQIRLHETEFFARGLSSGFNISNTAINFTNSAVDSDSNITTTANVAGSYFIGNVSGTTADFTGNITAGNIIANSVIDTTANITTTGNITGGYIIAGNDAGEDGIFIGDINGAIQQEVRNESGVTIDRGKAVYLTGDVTGDTPHVALANAEVVSKMPAIGIVKNQIANASVGEIVTGGQLNIGTHSFTIGSQLFINGDGDLTETIPTGESNLIQKIGKVVNTQQIIVQGAGRTNATPNLDEGNIFLGSSSGTAIAVAPDSNFDTTGNAFSLSNTLTDVNNITSESGANLNLKGQADGIHFDTTIDSTESRIVDLDTTGYSIADVELPADFTAGTNTPGFITLLTTTAGSNTATASSPIGISYFPALRGPTYATPMFTLAQTLEAVVTTAGSSWTGAPFGDQTANGLNNPAAGLYGQDKGWGVFDTTTSSIATLFPANAYVTDITNNTVTLSENALENATSRLVVFNPGMAQTSDSKTTVKYYANTHTGSNAEFISNYGRLSNFDLPESLSNTTFDAISYGNTTSVTTTVTMKNISDFAGTDESATRFKRGLLIGAATTPDPASGRSTLNQPSTLGVILESDGESFNDGLNTPAPRFLINNYSGGLDDLTSYPVWAQVGATGNLTLDLPQIKAPSLTLKSFRGAKSTANTTSYLMQAGDVVGKIAFSPAQTTGTANQGVDAVNPPAAITVDVGSANINTGVANAYMHITTTPYPDTNLGYLRNNANADSGANQQTNFTTKDGNLTLAAQTSGMISLAPTPDYGDAANSTVWTRYPGTTHEYHRFMDVGFLDKSGKNGTLVTIQPASGTTTGSGGLGYDSKGNATLRLSTHEANSVLKTYWDITNEHVGGNLQISQDGTDKVEISSDQTVFTNIPVMPSHSNTALPTSVAGGIIYVTNGNNKPAYGDGTNWYYYDNTQVT